MAAMKEGEVSYYVSEGMIDQTGGGLQLLVIRPPQSDFSSWQRYISKKHPVYSYIYPTCSAVLKSLFPLLFSRWPPPPPPPGDIIQQSRRPGQQDLSNCQSRWGREKRREREIFLLPSPTLFTASWGKEKKPSAFPSGILAEERGEKSEW